jgi:hypothetical protein
VTSLEHYLQGGVVAAVAVAVVGSVEPATRLALVAFWMKWGRPAA